MSQLYINDANVLIDLCDLNIVSEFLSLDNIVLCTTDFVMAEIDDYQAKLFLGKIIVIKSENEEIKEISDLMIKNNGLSIQDCSVWYYADKRKGTLVTSDSKLRKLAGKSGTQVKGILHIFELMKEQKCLSLTKCIEKLEELKKINPRSPNKLIDELIEKWNKEN